MKRDEQDEKELKLARQAAKRLDATLDQIDTASLERLRRARMASLAKAPRPGRLAALTGWRPYWLTPARFSLAAVALVAVSLFTVLPAHAPKAPTPEALEIATSNEQLAMLDDLDFYRWLAVSGKLPEH
jgi:hypothetical protein